MTIQGDEDLKDPKTELVERVRHFVAEEVVPRAASIDRENTFPDDVYRRMGEEGLLGLARPQGAGKTTLEWAVWIEELAASATVADIVCSADLVALILDEHGTQEQKSLIGPLLAGETIGAFALTETQAGSNAAAIDTAARGRFPRPQRQEGLDHLRHLLSPSARAFGHSQAEVLTSARQGAC